MEKQQRLIDANAMIRMLVSVKKDYAEEGNDFNEKVVDFLIKMFQKETICPTIDAVPVVRCNDCRFRGNPLICPMCHEEEYYEEDYGFDDIVRDKTFDNWYCPKGEREDDNE